MLVYSCVYYLLLWLEYKFHEGRHFVLGTEHRGVVEGMNEWNEIIFLDPPYPKSVNAKATNGIFESVANLLVKIE